MLNAGPKMLFCSSCMLVSPAVTTFSTIFSPAAKTGPVPHVTRANPSATIARGINIRLMRCLLFSAIAAGTIPARRMRRADAVREPNVVRLER